VFNADMTPLPPETQEHFSIANNTVSGSESERERDRGGIGSPFSW